MPRVKDSSKREVAFSLVLVYGVGTQVCVYQVDTDHHRPVRRAEMIKPPRTNAVVLVYYERPVKVGAKPKSALTTSKQDKERVTTRT